MIRKTWTDQNIKFVKENYGVLDPEEISESMGRTYSSIAHKASREHIVPQFKWSEEEIKLLEENYKNMTYRELSVLLPGRTKTAIDLKINKLGLHKEKYTYNKRFFQCIDSEEKAYWLGFIYADGCVFVNKGTNSGEVTIKLFSGDYKHLKKFNCAINGNIPVTFEERICSFNGEPASSCIIRCFSIDMANDLINVGCVPNKTFFIQMPDISEPLMNHFIRGFFDGDGCICRDSKKRNTLAINFCSASLVFLEQLRSMLFNQGINSYIVDEKARSTFRLYVKGMKNTDNMWNYMFQGASTCLERKFIKKNALYEEYNVAQRLLRLSEMAG